jgi:predicted Zn-dependent protease with MMP-like domain
MIKKGYVIKEGENFRPTIPVYTEEQYDKVIALTKEFAQKELADIICEMDAASEKILAAHTPKHLQGQVKGVSATDKFINAVGIPVSILEERRTLSTDWHPLEMPTTFAVLKL